MHVMDKGVQKDQEMDQAGMLTRRVQVLADGMDVSERFRYANR